MANNSASNRQIEIFRAALLKATAVLAQSGVDVTQIGTDAYCQWNDRTHKLERINIPMIPDNSSPEFLSAIQGFIDHEVAHALFTSAAELTNANRDNGGDKTATLMGNLVEDTRIEREMKARYAGSEKNIDQLVSHLSSEWRPALDKAHAAGDKRKFATSAFVPFLRGLAGDAACSKLSAEYGLATTFDDLLTKMPDLSARLKAVTTTEQAYALGRAIVKAMQEPPASKEDPKPKENPPPQSGESKPDEKDKDEGEDKAPSSGGSEKADDTDQDNQSDGEGQGGAGEDEGENGEGEGSDPTPGAAEDESSDEPPTKPGIGSTQDVDLNKLKDTSQQMGDAITARLNEFNPKGKVFQLTFDYDVVEPLEKIVAVPPETDVAKLDAEVASDTNAMAKHLQRVLVARAQSVMIGGFRRGRINSPALHRHASGDDRLFRRRQEAVTKAVAVTLLIDNSGSMSGTKTQMAMKAAYALCGTLTKLGIEHEALGFTTPTANGNPARIKKIDTGTMQARISRGVYEVVKALKIATNTIRKEPVVMPIYKAFDEKFNPSTKRRMAHFLANNGCGLLSGNDDATAVLVAGRRLKARPEPRKVLIVLSDGQPACGLDQRALQSSLISNIKDLSKDGVEVFGIGIMDQSVKNYYENYVVLQDAGKLVETVMKKLTDFLVRGGK